MSPSEQRSSQWMAARIITIVTLLSLGSLTIFRHHRTQAPKPKIRITSLKTAPKLLNVMTVNADAASTFGCVCCPVRLDLSEDTTYTYHCPNPFTTNPTKARLCQEEEMGGTFAGGTQVTIPQSPNPGGACVKKCMRMPSCACAKVNPMNGQCYLFENMKDCPKRGSYSGGQCGNVCVPRINHQNKVQEVCTDSIPCSAKCGEISSKLKPLAVRTKGGDQMAVCGVPEKSGGPFRAGFNEMRTGNVCVFGFGGKEKYTSKYKCLCIEKSVVPTFVAASSGDCGAVCASEGKEAVRVGSTSKDPFVCLYPNVRGVNTYPGSNIRGSGVCKVAWTGVEQSQGNFSCACV